MKHRFRRALAAVAVLASGLVAGTVQPAEATTYYSYTWANYASITAWVETNDSALPTWPVGTYEAAQCAAATFNVDPTELCGSPQFTDWTPGATQSSGGSATLRLRVLTHGTEADFPTCDGTVDNPTKVRVQIRNSSGTAVGSNFDYTIGSSGFGPCNSVDDHTKTVYFDTNPLDGVDNTASAPLTPGNYSMYLKFLDDDGTDNANASGIDSEGAHANGPNEYESAYKGTFTVTGDKMMAGFGQEGNSYKESKWIDDTLGKHFPVVRDFASSWVLPSSTRVTGSSGYMADGSAVVWSVKPPAADATWPASGDSKWKNAKDDTHGANGIRAQLAALQNAAVTYNIPWAMYAIHHEPHDEEGTSAGDGGTAAEYRALYQEVMTQKQTACSNSVCDRVLITYIAVPSNMDEGNVVIGGVTKKGGGEDHMRPQHAGPGDSYTNGSSTNGSTTFNAASASFSASDVGLPITGTNIPANTYIKEFVSSTQVKLSVGASGTGSGLSYSISRVQDYDLLGGDPYNWGCFREHDEFNDTAEAASGTRDLSNNTSDCADNSEATPDNEWRSLETAVDGLVEVAKQRDKKVFLAEVGSHPGCNGTEDNFQYGDYPEAPYDYVAPASESKYVMHGFFCNGAATNDATWDRGLWFDAMFQYLLGDEAQQYIVGFTYYHSNNCEEDKGNCWDFVDFNDEGTSTPDLIVQSADDRGKQSWINNVVNNSAFVSTPYAFNLDPTP